MRNPLELTFRADVSFIDSEKYDDGGRNKLQSQTELVEKCSKIPNTRLVNNYYWT